LNIIGFDWFIPGESGISVLSFAEKEVSQKGGATKLPKWATLKLNAPKKSKQF
jgi:hypothetical protein